MDATAKDICGSLDLALTTLRQARRSALNSMDAQWADDAEKLTKAIKLVESVWVHADVVDTARRLGAPIEREAE